MRPHRKPPRSRLTACRLRLGLTLQEVADLSGVSVPHLSHLERGVRTGTTATWCKLGAALCVSLAEIRPPTDERQIALFKEIA